MTAPPKMLFHRDFRRYTGGHGKVWDYFNHALALGWDARVFLTPRSIEERNPWLAMPKRIATDWHPESADVLFLAGMDWQAMDARGLLADRHLPPIVNLIQGLRHADPELPLRGFLSRPASRICVSTAVAQAIRGTGLVNGPVEVIPAGLNLPAVEMVPVPQVDVFIGALKKPDFGVALGERLRAAGYCVDVSSASVPRNEYLARVATARACAMLPYQTEGFYLPGLEAMALGCPLVMPDCGGSSEYARAGVNCLMPDRTLDAMVAAITQLDSPEVCADLIAQGRATAAGYTLENEARGFAAVLAEMGVG